MCLFFFRQEGVGGQSRLQFKIFTLSPAYGIIYPDHSQQILVECAAEMQGRFDEVMNLKFNISHYFDLLEQQPLHILTSERKTTEIFLWKSLFCYYTEYISHKPTVVHKLPTRNPLRYAILLSGSTYTCYSETK